MEVLQALTVLFTAMVKFLFAGAVAYSLGFTMLETMALTACGGAMGTLIFFYAGTWVLERFRRRYVRRRQERIDKGLPPKPIFTRTNRWIVRVKQGYGFWGLSVICPPILSIPVVAVLCAKYFRHDRRTLPTMISAVAGWSVVLSLAWSFLR
jgi:hypothetical protein